MNYCFILASLTGREHLLNDFVESAKKSKYRDCDFYLYFQNIDENQNSGIFDKSFFKEIFISNKRDGTCLPKMYWLHKLNNYDFFVLIDDDMAFLGKEDYETVMHFSNNVKECGICNTVCRRTIKHYYEYNPEKRFEIHNIQWTGGGQIIKKEIRDLLVKKIDLKPYTYDGFAIITYLNGYTNYRYLGSCALHKAGSKHGFEYTRKHVCESIPMLEKYIIDPFKENGRLSLPKKESDLTEEARKLHEVNRGNII